MGRIGTIVGIAHPRAVVVFTGVTLGVAVVASHGVPLLGTTVALALSVAFVQIAVGIFNDYYDRDLDAVSKPDWAIPAGLVRADRAYHAAWASLAAGLAVSAALGLPATVVLAAGAWMGILYSARLKRSVWSWWRMSWRTPSSPSWCGFP